MFESPRLHQIGQMPKGKNIRSVRIVGGSLGGRRIDISPRYAGRPTKNVVREALFDMIGDRINRSLFLDLFAGTGANGIEAVSRGALKSYLIDMDITSIKMCISSTSKFNIQHKVEIKRMDARRFISKAVSDNMTFDVIFADPPYALSYDDLREMFEGCEHLMSDLGILVVEVECQIEYPDRILGLRRTKVKTYGRTKLCFYEGVVSGNV